MARLGEICTVVSGTTPKSTQPEYWDGNLNWVTPAELTDESDIIYESQRKITQQAVIDSSLKSFPAGTVLLSSRAPIGKVAIAGTEMYCNQGFKNLICSEKIYNRYLYHFLKSRTAYLNSLGRGATFKEISKSIVENIEIPLPPLEEQRKIAAVLDKVSDLIAKRRQQLDKLDEMVKARFVEMFGDVIQNAKLWPQYIFSDITTSRLGKMLDAKQQTGMCQYPYLANFNVQWFRFELDNLNEMDFNEADRIEFELRDGDLLVCEGGEIGRCAVWHNEIQPCYFQKALHRVRCKKEIVLPDYLAWWFKYNCDNKGFAAIEGAKATISHLPGAKLKALLVSVPPIELQNQFAAFVEQTEKSKTTISRSLEKLETLKKALMQEYFG